MIKKSYRYLASTSVFILNKAQNKIKIKISEVGS